MTATTAGAVTRTRDLDLRPRVGQVLEYDLIERTRTRKGGDRVTTVRTVTAEPGACGGYQVRSDLHKWPQWRPDLPAADATVWELLPALVRDHLDDCRDDEVTPGALTVEVSAGEDLIAVVAVPGET